MNCGGGVILPTDHVFLSFGLGLGLFLCWPCIALTIENEDIQQTIALTIRGGDLKAKYFCIIVLLLESIVINNYLEIKTCRWEGLP